MLFRLWLYRITCINPSLKAAQDGSDMLITIMQQDERRTGTCVFLVSGAIGDDPLILIEFQSLGVALDFPKLDVERALHVARCVGIRAAHIDNDGLTGIKSSFGYIHRHARDLRLCGGKSA